MSLNSLRSIQYNNMYKMVNAFLYEYRCDMELRVYGYEKEIYERDCENKRKRKLVKKEQIKREYLVVHGNGEEYICSVVKSDDGKFEIFKDMSMWDKGAKPYCIAEDSKQAEKMIEEICRQHYINKYGECRHSYHGNYFSERKLKRLSVGEICDWYNQFKKLDMSIDDVKNIILENKELKKEINGYEKLLIGVAKKKGLIKNNQ